MKFLRICQTVCVMGMMSGAVSTSFVYFAPRVWNALPPRVISADSLNSFKAPLKSHLFDIV